MDTERTTIAILGGGQLGMMLGQAGAPLGLRFRFLDPVDAPPAHTVGPCVVGALDDPVAIAELVADADVVTYEWEGVPAAAARTIAATHPLHPNADALAVSQDRLTEKQRFAALDIPTAPFVAVDTLDDLNAAIGKLGTPAILKTRTGGYDGKGQVRIDDAATAADAWAAIQGHPAILEGVVPFVRELSVIAARSTTGEVRVFPIAQNHHALGILRTSIAPAPGLEPERVAQAEEFIGRLLSDLDYVGVLALELFETSDGLAANEFAPRVHNSGHWTIEGATTSQFEQHLRAITGMPLGSTDAVGVSAMCNCIGRMPDPDAIAAIPGTYLHDYGKEPRRSRKLGHVTVVAKDLQSLEARIAAVQAILPVDG